MQFGSLSSSLFGLLSGMPPSGDAPSPASPSEGLSFAEALVSAMAVDPEVVPAELAWPGGNGGQARGTDDDVDDSTLLETATPTPGASWVPLDAPIALLPEMDVTPTSPHPQPPTPLGTVAPTGGDGQAASPLAPPLETEGATPSMPTSAAALASIPEAIVVVAETGPAAGFEESNLLSVGAVRSDALPSAEPATPAAEASPRRASVDPGPVPPSPLLPERAEPQPAAAALPLPATSNAQASAPDPAVHPEPGPPVRPELSVTALSREPVRPLEAFRLLSTIVPREVEIHVDRVAPGRPEASAATLVRDLGHSLASRPLTSAGPSPVISFPVATPPSTPSAAPAGPVAVAPVAIVTVETPTAVENPTPLPVESTSTPPPSELPVEREAPLRRESPGPAPAPLSGSVGTDRPGGETGRQDSSASGDGSRDDQPAPSSPPLAPPPMDAPSPAPTPPPGPLSDLQMQARQAVARTVVRMGEDQLLASVRPTTVRLQLSPSHLGQIQIAISQNPQRGLDVTIHAAVEETQRALEADADDMLESLRSQKLDVARVSVRSEGDRSEGDPRQRSDFFRQRDQASRDDSSTTEGEGGHAQDRGGHSRGGQQPPHADPTDYRYWEAIR